MVEPYKKQPLKVAALVLLVVIVGVAGSYMLYNLPNAKNQPVERVAAEAGWDAYKTHHGRLDILYPPTWSVKEASADTQISSYRTVVTSPDEQTIVTIIDNMVGAAGHINGGQVGTEPARLAGKTYAWNYIQATQPVQGKNDDAVALTASLMASGDAATATWPVSPGTPTKYVAISIWRGGVYGTVQQLQQVPDFQTAKRIAQSIQPY